MSKQDFGSTYREFLCPMELFPVPSLGGGYPIQSPDGGTTSQGGTPSQVWVGGTPSQIWVVRYPISGLGGGTPSQVSTGGTPSQGVPHPRSGQGVPHPRSGQGVSIHVVPQRMHIQTILQTGTPFCWWGGGTPSKIRRGYPGAPPPPPQIQDWIRYLMSLAPFLLVKCEQSKHLQM